jgi:hypothetical protein
VRYAAPGQAVQHAFEVKHRKYNASCQQRMCPYISSDGLDGNFAMLKQSAPGRKRPPGLTRPDPKSPRESYIACSSVTIMICGPPMLCPPLRAAERSRRRFGEAAMAYPWYCRSLGNPQSPKHLVGQGHRRIILATLTEGSSRVCEKSHRQTWAWLDRLAQAASLRFAPAITGCRDTDGGGATPSPWALKKPSMTAP